MRLPLLIILCLGFPFVLLGQKDTTTINDGWALPEVEIRSMVSVEKNSLKRIAAPASLSEATAFHRWLNVKDYGPGSLATISLRGHAASQTAIVLDGFKLNSPMNGLYDLSLLPTFFLEKMEIDAMASSAEVNGGVGGMLNMKSAAAQGNDQLQLGVSYGSFDDTSGFLSLRKKWNSPLKAHSIFRAFYRHAANDFTYQNTNGEKVALPNADVKQWGVLQKNSLLLPDSSQIRTHFWWLDNARGIPPTLTTNHSKERQYDQLLNAIVSWEKDWNTQWETDIAVRYANEHILYDSPIVQTDSRANILETRVSQGFQYRPKHHFSATAQHQYTQAHVEDYEGERATQNVSFLQLSHEWTDDGVTLKTAVKSEYAERQWSPLLWAFSLNYEKTLGQHRLGASAAISRDYRRPTFNDLYWQVGQFTAGNPQLSPEHSWRQTLGVSYAYQWLMADARIFHARVEDWILWSPNSAGVWMPENLRTVRSLGWELDVAARIFTTENYKIQCKGHYRYTQTTQQEVEDNRPNIIGKQLIYVPLHAAGMHLDINWQRWRLSYGHTFQGKVFTTTDNSQYLNDFSIGQISLSYVMNTSKWSIRPTIEINNVYNTDYQTVANRPLPPRNYQLTIFLTRG